VGDTSLFTVFSINGEHIPDIFSERRGSILRASVRILMVEYLPRATVVLKGLFAGKMLHTFSSKPSPLRVGGRGLLK